MNRDPIIAGLRRDHLRTQRNWFVFDLTTQHDEASPKRKIKLILRQWFGPARQKYSSVAPHRVSKCAFFSQPGGLTQLSRYQAKSQRDTTPTVFGLSFGSSDLTKGTRAFCALRRSNLLDLQVAGDAMARCFSAILVFFFLEPDKFT